MKYLKSITFAVLLVFGLSGCYTQLQYSQKMKRITDRGPSGDYAWDGEEQAYANEEDYEGTANNEYYGDYVPAYKDYETAEFYNDCNCNIYDYQEGYFDGVEDALTAVRYDYFQPYYSSYFRFNLGFYYPYFGSRFGFYYNYGPSWYYYHRFYSPFYYSPFYYHPFYSGYGPFYSYNYFYFNNGYRYYDRDYRDNRRYGPRSIGGSRLSGNSSTRTRSGSAGTDIRTRTRSNSQGDIRTRSNTSTRSRGTVDRTRTRSGSGSVGTTRTRSGSGSGSVNRTRSGNNGSDGTRSRSGNVNRSRDNDEYISRVGILQNRYSRSVRDIQADIQRRNLLQRARERYQQQNRQSSNGILGRLKSIFRSSDRNIRIDRSRSGNTIRSRSSGSNNTRSVQRSRSNSRSSSGSSVGRSRSGSSSSSGNSSSRSRSRSGGNSRSRSGGN